MKNKLSLTFLLLLAASCAYSTTFHLPIHAEKGLVYPQNFPDCNGNAECEEMITMIRAMQGSGTQGESWQDLFLNAIFKDDDTETDPKILNDPDYGFRPILNLNEIIVRMNHEITEAHKRKCKKISGNDETFAKFTAAKKELGQCIKHWSKQTKQNSLSPNNRNYHRIQLNKVCQSRDVLNNCIDKFMTVEAQCSFPGEIAFTQSANRIMRSTMDLVCVNDGNDIFNLAVSSDLLCPSNTAVSKIENNSKTCAMKAQYTLMMRFFIKFMENEKFEFKMDAEDCKQFDVSKDCFDRALEPCETPKKFVSEMFQIIRNETACASNYYG